MISTIIAFIRGSEAARIALVAVGVALLLYGLMRWVDRAQDKAIAVSHEAGRAEQRADDQAEILNKVEKANEAVETIRRDAGAARAGCLRYSRTPQNCQ